MSPQAGFDPPSAEVQTSTECEFDTFTLQATMAGLAFRLHCNKSIGCLLSIHKHAENSPDNWSYLKWSYFSRLGLERGSTALEALEIITKLLEEHGQVFLEL